MINSPLYLSFLVRMWPEPNPEQPETRSAWRGEVQHIQTGRHYSFDTIEALLDFLRRQAAGLELGKRSARE